MERDVFGTVRGTLAAVNTFFIVTALQRHLTLMGKRSMGFNLLTNGSFIFANSLSNGSFRGAVGNTGENDTPFV